VRGVYVSQAVRKYAIDLVAATRHSPDLRLGASPRSTLQLVRAARAHAALTGRDYVIPDDLQDLAVPVLAHRLLPSVEAQGQRRLPEQVVTELVRRVPVPETRAS
jgi:MoxR-like ATPase